MVLQNELTLLQVRPFEHVQIATFPFGNFDGTLVRNVQLHAHWQFLTGTNQQSARPQQFVKIWMPLIHMVCIKDSRITAWALAGTELRLGCAQPAVGPAGAPHAI